MDVSRPRPPATHQFAAALLALLLVLSVTGLRAQPLKLSLEVGRAHAELPEGPRSESYTPVSGPTAEVGAEYSLLPYLSLLARATYTRFSNDQRISLLILSYDPWANLMRYHGGHVTMGSAGLGLKARSPTWADRLRAYVAVTGGPYTYTYTDQVPERTGPDEQERRWKAGLSIEVGISARLTSGMHLTLSPSFTRLVPGEPTLPRFRSLQAGLTVAM